MKSGVVRRFSQRVVFPVPDGPAKRATTPADGSADIGTKKLGEDPKTGLDVTVRSGRFGPYVQLGEGTKEEKPKRAGLPKGTAPEDMDLERALALLALPREVA